ncbi:hypothetical protein BKA61DRAFT_616009, partial [Leptodontidium sp. MPI-SDFR-AT-0119]
DVEREAQSGPTRDPNTSTRTTTNEAITIEFSNSPGTLTNKTRKILPARKRARKDTETAGDISRVGAIEFTGRNGGKGTWLEEMAWLIIELKTGQEELKAGNEELKTHIKALIEELAELVDVISISGSFTRIRSIGESLAPLYALVLTGLKGSTSGPPPGSILLGITIDTRRIKDKTVITVNNISNTEKRIKALIHVRGQNVRVLTSTEKEAALLRVNDKTRVKALVVNDNSYIIKESFAERFYIENRATAIIKAFWLFKGNKRTGLIAVFLASEEEAQQIISNRLVKRVARLVRCYNYN